MYNKNEQEQFERWGKTPPSHTPHGDPEDIKKNMKPAVTRDWRQEGNRLICKTDLGEVGQVIPADMILQGTDENGLPILKKVVL